MNNLIEVRDLSKTFTLHQQQGVVLNVLRGLNFNVAGGECLVLHGRSGAGKSTLLRTLYGNYLPAGGSIRLRHAGDWLELVGAEPREVLAVRRQTLGYVSQFLRVIPRVATLDVVMEPALARGWSRDSAELRARSLLARLNIPERLWQLAPGTFSGGEQQRVNIARGFMVEWPILLLDEPTASLDEANRQVVLELIGEAAASGDARADHRLHLRCEVSHPQTLEVFRELVEHPLVQLVSVMDHAPGQRQFARLEKYREYYQGKYHLSDAEMDAFIVEQVANSERYSDAARAAIVDVCQGRGLSVASHDDATLAHVRESAGYGMAIAEFPTTVEAARASHEHGLQVLMGAPNVVRGGSHSGNVAAAQLAGIGVLDILSSDYYPASLLHAALLLAGEHSEYDAIRYDLPRAVAMVSRTPALAAGLTDRGEIRVGLRADLLQARALGNNQPVVRQVWRGGQRVF
uniref:alpha-D-ribose 1-methylphosphonate 5-triphosphate diphosphatase n=1 Tax=Pseudomonas aeruginosa TaxID=287 RepID=UPI003F5890C2